MQEQTPPVRLVLRRFIQVVLPLDSDLEALCRDHFPDIAIRFTNSMDRVSKITMLLDLADSKAILVALHQQCPQGYAEHGGLLHGFVDLSQVKNAQHTLPTSSLSQPCSRDSKQSQGTMIMVSIGILLLPFSAIGASLTVTNYHKLFVSVGALGGLYLLFGLFFNNISMFSERHRARILTLLVIVLILLTLVLGAHAAMYYYRAQQERAKNNKSLETAVSSKNNKKKEAWSPVDLSQPLPDLFYSDDAIQGQIVFQPTEPNEKPANIHSGHQVQVSPKLPEKPQKSPSPAPSSITPNPPPPESPETKDMSTSGSVTSPIKPKIVPAGLIQSNKISGDDPQLPNIITTQHQCENLLGSYKVCLDVNGNISTVNTIGSIPEADEQIIATLKKWRYKPQAMPICFIKTFEYYIESAKCPMGKDSHEPSSIASAIPKTTSAALIRKDKISTGDDPHLPDEVKSNHRCEILTGSYQVCIGTNGDVIKVEAKESIPGGDSQIIATLQGWRFKPQTAQVCFVQFLEFEIDTQSSYCADSYSRTPVGIEQLKRLPRHANQKCEIIMQQQWDKLPADIKTLCGLVNLRIALEPDGNIRNIKINESLNPRIDRMIVDSLRSNSDCRFSPAVGKNGKLAAFVIDPYIVTFICESANPKKIRIH